MQVHNCTTSWQCFMSVFRNCIWGYTRWMAVWQEMVLYLLPCLVNCTSMLFNRTMCYFSYFLKTKTNSMRIGLSIWILVSEIWVVLQHANEDVEKMILGNKCDMEDKRQVSKDRGDAVSKAAHLLYQGLRNRSI